MPSPQLAPPNLFLLWVLASCLLFLFLCVTYACFPQHIFYLPPHTFAVLLLSNCTLPQAFSRRILHLFMVTGDMVWQA